MALISFSEFRSATHESSPATRSKTAAAQGLGPDVADVFGHSTPPPSQVKKLLKKIKKNRKKEDSVQEKRELRPDYSFDQLIRKAAVIASDINDQIQKADKESDEIDKNIEKEKAQKKKKSKQNSTKLNTKSPKTNELPNDQFDKDDEEKTITQNQTNKKINPKDQSDKDDKNPSNDLTTEQIWLKLANISFENLNE